MFANRYSNIRIFFAALLISSYWAHGQLEVPEIKWVRTNNYKFHTFRLVHFDLSLSPRPSFWFSKGQVPRLYTRCHA